MHSYGCYVKFTARPGERDALVEHLLSAAGSSDLKDGGMRGVYREYPANRIRECLDN